MVLPSLSFSFHPAATTAASAKSSAFPARGTRTVSRFSSAGRRRRGKEANPFASPPGQETCSDEVPGLVPAKTAALSPLR